MSTTLTISKGFNCDRHSLFEDFIKSDKMKHWFFTEDYWTSEIHNNPREGGKFEVEIVSDIGNSYTSDGKYKKIVEDEELVFTWDSSLVENSEVKIHFKKLDDLHTNVFITHSNLPDDEAMIHYQQFWQKCLKHLEDYVENPSPYPIYQDPDYKAAG